MTWVCITEGTAKQFVDRYARVWTHAENGDPDPTLMRHFRAAVAPALRELPAEPLARAWHLLERPEIALVDRLDRIAGDRGQTMILGLQGDRVFLGLLVPDATPADRDDIARRIAAAVHPLAAARRPDPALPMIDGQGYTAPAPEEIGADDLAPHMASDFEWPALSDHLRRRCAGPRLPVDELLARAAWDYSERDNCVSWLLAVAHDQGHDFERFRAEIEARKDRLWYAAEVADDLTPELWHSEIVDEDGTPWRRYPRLETEEVRRERRRWEIGVCLLMGEPLPVEITIEPPDEKGRRGVVFDLLGEQYVDCLNPRDGFQRQRTIERVASFYRVPARAFLHLDGMLATAALRIREPKDVAPAAKAPEIQDAFRPFPADRLPDPLARFVAEGAAALGCDPSMIALPLLAGLAGTIGNTRFLEVKRGWRVPANLWTAVIAESGMAKSPAQRLALQPLHALQAEAVAQHAREMEEYEVALDEFKREMKHWEKHGGKLGEPRPEKPREPIFHHFYLDNTTIEAVGDALATNPRGFVLATDELGTFLLGLNQYKPGGKGNDAAQWLQMHNAGPLKIDRKSGKLFIPRANVSITGGIQPDTLRRALGHEHVANGLAARFLFAQPPRRPRRWTDAEMDDELAGQVSEIFERLATLRFTMDRDGNPQPVIAGLTPEAKRAFVKYVNEHGEEQATLTGPLASAWSKLEEAAARVALVVHLAAFVAEVPGVAEDRVDEASMAAGITLARWFAAEARRTYDTLTETEAAREARELMEAIAALGGEVRPRDLARNRRGRFRTAEDAEAALSELVKLGKGEWVDERPTEKGGRPTRRFRLVGYPSIGGQNRQGADETPEKPEENEVSSAQPWD